MRRLGERPSDKDLMDMIAEVDEVKIVCVAGSIMKLIMGEIN